MAQWPGLGDRIKARLVELGYKQANGKPDILGFSLKHSYIAMYLYKWANAGVMPSQENIERLAKDLAVSAPWLLFGDEVEKAPIPPRKRGGHKVGCVVAALGITLGLSTPSTAWGPSRASGQPTPIRSVVTAENVRGIMSSRRRRIARCKDLRELTCRAA